MHIRTKFVTNSSSTSIVGWGAYVTKEQFKKLDYEFPKGVDYACPPSDDYILYVPMPNISVTEDCLLKFPEPAVIQKELKALQEALKSIGAKEGIYYIEEGWYNG
jgi:hypothetical protein